MRIPAFICFSIMVNTGAAQWPFDEEALASNVLSRHYDPKLIGGGVVIFDYNNDGHEDLYFTGGLENDKLFRNMGNGKFEDVSIQTGIAEGVASFKTVGAVSADLNNDGFKDLIVTTDKNEPNLVLRNINATSFQVLQPFPDDPKAWSTSVIVSDFNKDSYLDVYVLNYVTYEKEPFFQWRTGGIPNNFYRNDGNFNFTDITQPTQTEDSGAGLAGTFSDFDGDGDDDLFIINDFGYEFEPNTLFINQFPQVAFSEIGETSKAKAAIDGMGIAIGDHNEDGLPDYYISNFQANLLLTNLGNDDFDEQALQKKVQVASEVSWGTFFCDVNNDSYLDLFVANGSMTDPGDKHKNRLFLQDAGSRNFIDVTPGNLPYNTGTSRGAAFGDLDNDGDTDAVIVRVSDVALGSDLSLVYINQGEHNNNRWFKLILKGTISNPDAYGAHVRLYLQNRLLIREVSGGSSYLSQNSPVLHFGLGNYSRIDSLLVRWPNGLQEKYYNLEVDQFMEAVEDEGLYPANVSDVITAAPEDRIRGPLVLNPNPFNDRVQITIEKMPSHSIPEFYFFDTIGQPLQAIHTVERLSDTAFILHLDQALAAKMYILKTVVGHQAFNHKIIKQQ